MYLPRKISKYGLLKGLKAYCIQKEPGKVDFGVYLERLSEVLADKGLENSELIGFVIFHEGSEKYLVLSRWGNGNELLTSASVFVDGAWIEDSDKYSFCVWDLEVMWYERNSFIRHMYSGNQDLGEYRNDFCVEPVAGGDATRWRS